MPAMSIAEIFVAVLLEPPSSAQDTTITSAWATAHCFWYHKGKKEYRLMSPGGCSKMMAAVHNLLRVGSCTSISKMDGGATFQSDATALARRVREAPCQSWLGGAIRTWRDISGRISSKDPPTTTDKYGNVCIGGQVLKRSTIRRLIPTISQRLLDAFAEIVTGNGWKDITDPVNEILFHRKADGTIYFDVLHPNNTKKSSDDYFLNSLDAVLLNTNLSNVA